MTPSDCPLSSYLERHDPALRSFPVLSAKFITFGVKYPPFDDVRVRRAFSLCIDREGLLRGVLPGKGDAAWTFNRPGTGGYELPPQFRYDPAEAQRLLAAAGYPGGEGFPTVELTLAGSDTDLSNYGQALQQIWRETLRVDVQLAPTEFKVWIDMVRSKTLRLSTDTWNMTVNDPVELLALGTTGDPNNDADWSNPAYDAAFQEIGRAKSPAERAAAILACERLIAQDMPYAPIYHANVSVLVHSSVQGYRGNLVQYTDFTALWLK